jgi:hypothetical protein
MQKDYAFVRYEEMTRDPQKVRQSLADRLGLECPPLPEVFQMKKYHISAGNGMRFNPEITIRHDESWKNRLTPELLEVADAAQAKLLIRLERFN